MDFSLPLRREILVSGTAKKIIYSRRHAGIGSPVPLIRQAQPNRPHSSQGILKQRCGGSTAIGADWTMRVASTHEMINEAFRIMGI